jgi:hypothetical protein
MLRAVVTFALVALAACSTDSTTPSSTSSTTPPASADPALTDLVRSLSASAGVHVLEVQPGTIVRVVTDLERRTENGSIGLGLCLNAQAAAGGQPEVQVVAADGGVLASTRDGLCAARV